MSELVINSGASLPQKFVKTQGNIRLRAIEKRHELEDVYRLTYNCYLAQGYCLPNSNERLIHYPHLDVLAETSILVVETDDGEIVGTCSTTIDNEYGLHVDEDFLQETNQVRKEGGILASSWRIAVDPNYRAGSRVARMLVNGSLELWHQSGVDICMMTLNPCHEGFYRRYGNCITLAKKDGLKDLRNAAAVLVRWDRYRCPFAEKYDTRIM